MIDARTIAELEAAGFTHIFAPCAAAECGAIVHYPFRLLRAGERIDDSTTMAAIRKRYRCQKCGGRAASAFEPWRQGLSQKTRDGGNRADDALLAPAWPE